MTPEAFAAILAARTPGRWLVPLDIPNGVGEDIYEENQDKCLARWVDPEDAAAIVAAVNLAPLLLDLWEAASEVSDLVNESRVSMGASDALGRMDAALAALEAAT